jgi:hypothetical protein
MIAIQYTIKVILLFSNGGIAYRDENHSNDTLDNPQ